MISKFSNLIVPLEIGQKPEIQLKRVVLPLPFGPIIPVRLDGSIVNDTSLNIFDSPIVH